MDLREATIAARGKKKDSGACKAIKVAWTSCVSTGRLALVGGGDSESVLENAGAGSCMHVAVLPQAGYSLLQGSQKGLLG